MVLMAWWWISTHLEGFVYCNGLRVVVWLFSNFLQLFSCPCQAFPGKNQWTKVLDSFQNSPENWVLLLFCIQNPQFQELTTPSHAGG